MIPKLIHQTWRSRSVEPEFRKEWVTSWQVMNPEWEYRLWLDEDIMAFVNDHYPSFYRTFEEYDVQIKRVDAWRYLVLRTLGGVYADLDTACLRPLDELCSQHGLIFGCQWSGDWEITDDWVCNAVMASVPGHCFWDDIAADLTKSKELGVIHATGPGFLTRRVRRKQEEGMDLKDLTILPSESFYPFPWNDSVKTLAAGMSIDELQRGFPRSYAVNFWTATWLSESGTDILS